MRKTNARRLSVAQSPRSRRRCINHSMPCDSSQFIANVLFRYFPLMMARLNGAAMPSAPVRAAWHMFTGKSCASKTIATRPA